MSFGSIIVFINIDKDKNIIINGGPDKEGGFSYNSDGTVTLGEGMVSNGFWDSETGAIVDQGTLLKPIDRKIRGRISFSQNIPDTRNHLLIIMIDYVQQSFCIDNNKYSTYSFSLKGN